MPAAQVKVAEAGQELILSGLLDGAEAETIRLINKMVEAAKNDYPGGLRQVDAWTREAEEFGGMKRVLAEGLPKAFTLYYKALAEVRCVRVGLALERFRIDDNHWPAELKDLVPEYLDTLLKDPFDGLPLRYRQSDDKVVVYSVGENFDDEGGVTGKGKMRADYGFRLLRPELRLVDSTSR